MYTTNLPRAALAILVGTIAGAILVTLWSFWGNTDFQYLREYWQRDALIVFTYAAFVWAAGLFVVAPGPWAMLHRNGIRDWWAAVGLGATLSFVVTLGLLTDCFGLVIFQTSVRPQTAAGRQGSRGASRVTAGLRHPNLLSFAARLAGWWGSLCGEPLIVGCHRGLANADPLTASGQNSPSSQPDWHVCSCPKSRRTRSTANLRMMRGSWPHR